MLNGKKIIVVMPAYNAGKTMEATYLEIPSDLVDEVVVVDDGSSDNTVEIASKLGLTVIEHQRNLGYGENQKTCYNMALQKGADIIIMLHPDYQYTPKLIPSICHMLISGEFDVVLASRILGGEALKGGMPVYKYVANRFLTFIQNICYNNKLSEYHTGYRAYTRRVLEEVPYHLNSTSFVFDAEFLAQVLYKQFRIGELSCPTKYFPEASSINFKNSLIYGIGCLNTCWKFSMSKLGIRHKLFSN